MAEDQELISLLTHPTDNHIASTNNVEQVDILLDAILNNKKDELFNALLECTEETFKKKHFQCEARNIVTIACDYPEVSANIFETLFRYILDNFRNLDLTEERWYYWQPIHFAAYNIDLAKLKIMTRNKKYLDRNKVNSLTIFSENALHVLLEYGKRIESFSVQLSNGWESRICHVIAQEKRDLVDCAKELVNAGIDVNHTNIWNETPLIIAIRYRLMGIIDMLLKRKDIDLDSSRDPYNRKSARELLRENEISVHLLNSAMSLIHTPAKILFNYLKSGDEEQFLRYNNENIRQYSNDYDGDNKENNTGTMLHLCLLKGYIDYKQVTTSLQSSEKDIMKSSMLKVFCQKGLVRSIEHLLSNGADVTKKHGLFNNLNVFQISVKFSYYPFLAILLQHKTNQISQYDILDALKNTNETSFVVENYHLRHVLYLLISKLETFFESVKLESIDYDSRDILNDILDLYLKYNVNKGYDENIRQVLCLGASVVSKSEDFSRLKLISYETLSSHLDDCIDDSNTVCYNSFVLDEYNNYSETKVLHYLTQTKKKSNLLNHPAFIILIQAKWLQTNKFFYWNIAFYCMFLISLYIHVVSIEIDKVNTINTYLFLVFLVIQTFKELVQLVLYRLKYFREFLNYMEMLILISCYVTIFLKNELCMVISTLLSTLTFLLMLGQMPRFTKYMIIFSSTKYFFEYAMFYFLQFFAFALCFFILLPSKDGGNSKPVTEIFVRLFDSLVFFIGQYDGPVSQPEEFPILARIIVATYIFCMTIILNNLLVGLIVTDMDVIQKTSKLLTQVKMIKYIVRIETFLRRLEGFYCCKRLKFLFENTQVFEPRKQKFMSLESCEDIFDDEDKSWLKKIHNNRQPGQNVLEKLYEYIVNEVYKDHKNINENKNILFKLTKLEEQIRRIKL